jgi:molybdenum cofactor sulfurtransferase
MTLSLANDNKDLMTAQIDSSTGYILNITDILATEYPQLLGTTYLDHAGTTPYAHSLITRYTQDLMQNLFGNPHTNATSSYLSSQRVDDARSAVLKWFHADPEEYDVVFVANSTAGIKLVGECLRDYADEDGRRFGFGWHADAHTSVVGLREIAGKGSRCFGSDEDVEESLGQLENGSGEGEGEDRLELFAYPAQSNMTGRRLPLSWTRRISNLRQTKGFRMYSLLDAAALVSTSPLDLSAPSTSPDFTVLSFYKMFGFPDLGALIVKKSAGNVLRRRKYFGGGTVESVGSSWHAKKAGSLHDALEDGTLPIHNIIALQHAMDVHSRLYGKIENVARHTKYLANMLRTQLKGLRHSNGTAVCEIYDEDADSRSLGGPVIALNLKDHHGKYVSNSEVEKLATVKTIQFRTGGLCNPGGIATRLELSDEDLQQNYAVGQRCGGDNDIINGKPSGAIRLSLGAMSSLRDVNTFIEFAREFYIDDSARFEVETPDMLMLNENAFMVESLSVFPIKSCAAYKIPASIRWQVRPKGLAWDREWCVVHRGTNVALSQKRFPRMALLRPEVDLEKRLLKVFFDSNEGINKACLELSLGSEDESSSIVNMCGARPNNLKPASVCGQNVEVHVYNSSEVIDFFTEALGVPCTLARFPHDGLTIRQAQVRIPGNEQGRPATRAGKSIALANESPILLVSRSSVNRLNEQIKKNSKEPGKAVTADSFRGNIVIAEEKSGWQMESPYAEDEWAGLRIGDDSANVFDVLGPCQRCQMVCVDQKSAQRQPEPFSTLAKTRKMHGKVWFGMHMSLTEGLGSVAIQIGDRITPVY